MEKITSIRKQSSDISNNKHAAIWDCGSSLYDSFELKSFERQLDSAISSSRSMSMPHLSHRRPPPPLPPPKINKKPTSKISRSLRRLIRSLLFRPKNNKINNNNNNNASFGDGGFVDERSEEGFYAVYDDESFSSALTTIPEVVESDGLSPEIKSLVRRTASDRFTFRTAVPPSNIIGICA